MWDNEQVLLSLVRLTSAEKKLAPGVTRYDNLNLGDLFVIETPRRIVSPDDLLTLLGGRKWFHQYNLEARPLFTYIMLDLVRAPQVPSAGLGIGDDNKVYLGVHLLSRFEKYDWDTIASALGKALQGTPS